MAYKPPLPFNVAMKILIPTVSSSYGVTSKSYPKANEVDDSYVFFGSFRTFGGTEVKTNDTYTLLNTATIDTWYRNDIKADSRIYLIDTDEVYEVKGTPENIGMQYNYLQFKVQKVGGVA